MKIDWFIAACFAGLSFHSIAQNPPLKLSGAETQAMAVIDLETGVWVEEYQADKLVTPASLTKLFTTAAMLKILGPDTCFTTSCAWDSLQHRVVAIGGGDPSLGSEYGRKGREEEFLDDLATALANCCASDAPELMLDVSCFEAPRYPSVRLWEDMANYYGAAPSALSFRDNRFVLTLQSPANPGERCKVVSMVPQWGKFPECLVVSALNGRDSAYIYGHAVTDHWYISGSIPAGKAKFEVKGALPDPPAVFGSWMKQGLLQRHIQTGDQIHLGKADALHHKVLAQTHSAPVKELCRVINFYSQNLYADHGLLHLGGQLGVRNWDNGLRMLHCFAHQTTGTHTLRFFDGSGLAPYTVVTTRAVATLLKEMYCSNLRNDFVNSLPRGGAEGTVGSRWRDPVFQNRIRLKSGSMNGVVAYAGYLITVHNRPLAFCIVVNHAADSGTVVRDEIESWTRKLIRKKF